mmetsp:Transcript_96398/g.281702  ORF Transcript_96398/g.281702 Transcript_96398/m.281702 type:complete len:446 (+) Transcript_96398:340-1677(+)
MLEIRSSCVHGSIDEVASSRSSRPGRFGTIRARQSSCRWPMLKPQPPLPPVMAYSRRPGSDSTHCDARTCRKASHNCLSVSWPEGSRLWRTVPENSTGSWGTSPTASRKAVRLTVAVSTPLSSTRPLRGSTIRKSANSKVDLPQPVRPTMPTCWEGVKARSTPRSTSAEARYRAQRPSICTRAPPANHELRRRSNRWPAGPQSSSASAAAEPEMPLTPTIWQPSGNRATSLQPGARSANVPPTDGTRASPSTDGTSRGPSGRPAPCTAPALLSNAGASTTSWCRAWSSSEQRGAPLARPATSEPSTGSSAYSLSRRTPANSNCRPAMDSMMPGSDVMTCPRLPMHRAKVPGLRVCGAKMPQSATSVVSREHTAATRMRNQRPRVGETRNWAFSWLSLLIANSAWKCWTRPCARAATRMSSTSTKRIMILLSIARFRSERAGIAFK